MKEVCASETVSKSAQGQALTGILILLGAVACFSCMDASAKWLARELPPLEIAGLRYLVSLLIVSCFLNPVRSPDLLRTRKPLTQIARGVFLVGMTLGCFIALKQLPLTQMTSISFAAPLLTALLAGPVLGERIGPRRLVAVLVGFMGVLIITRPFGTGFQPAVLLAVSAAISNAFYFLSTRLLASHDRPETTMFYTSLVGTVLVSPLLFLYWQTPATLMTWSVLFALGFFGALGHWLLILAHRHAPASTLAPFFYSQILGATLFGFLLFNSLPDRWTVVGGAIVISSGLYLLHRERIRQKFPSTDLAT